MAVPSLGQNYGLDTSDKNTRGMTAGAMATSGDATIGSKKGDPLDGANLLRLAQEAESQSTTFLQSGPRANWARSYKALRSQHFEASKYNQPEYRGRSKYFRPKTRTAVKKKMANAAQAMFSTNDVCSITAENEADDFQVASAALKQALLNYRLSRPSRRNGIPWFMVSMGALQTALATGVCISKQTWKYREEDAEAGSDGQFSVQPPIIFDRPDINLLPPENVLFDPNCDWLAPAQSSQYLILRYPMSVDEALAMIEQNVSCGAVRFKKINRSELASRVRGMSPADTTAARAAREGGKDPVQQTSGHFGRVWLNEVFMRVGNLDVVYWTVDNQILLSDPISVRKAYPAACGDRPVTIGYGDLEAFRPYPMSPVEALQQMQMELNDQTNLRLDHMKQVVSPPAKVVRGQKVDLQQVQRRGPNGIVMVNKMEDVEWWQPPDVPQSAFVENNVLTSDFDTLAGVFDQGSVNTNRQLGETVGGMRLLANSVNPVAEFDLNVWIETWVEPTLAQVVKLQEMYESDENVLAICGQKAQLNEKFGLDEITDTLLTRETTLTIKVGIGSTSLPEEKIKRFANAFQVAQMVLQPFIAAKVIQPPVPKLKEIMETIFGAAGFSDGGDRFFSNMDGAAVPPQGPDPVAMAENDVKQQQVQAGREKAHLDFAAKTAALEQKKTEAIAKVQSDHMKALAEIGKAMMDNQHTAGMQARDHFHDHVSQQHSMLKDQINADADRAARATQAAQAGQAAQQPQQPQGF